jgi:hypothetical protein
MKVMEALLKGGDAVISKAMLWRHHHHYPHEIVMFHNQMIL